MARASKSKGKGTKGRKGKEPKPDTTLTAEPEPSKASGVHFDDEGPTFDHVLNVQERSEVADELAAAQVELDDRREAHKDVAQKHGRECKRLTKRISKLAQELASGIRHVPAQLDIPGTGAPEIEPDDADEPEATLPPPTNGVTEEGAVREF